MQITEVQTPIPDYTITVEKVYTPRYGDVWSWTVKMVHPSGNTEVVKECRYVGRLTRWGATYDAKRAIKRMIRQRTRTYNVTVEA